MKQDFYRQLIEHVNRKNWWHVPPLDPNAYRKRGMFLASSFGEAEFYGRPLDKPQNVKIVKPLVGDERTVAKTLRVPPQREGMTLEQIAENDARWRDAALKMGFDAIVLMTPKSFSKWKTSGKIPRSMELNLLCEQSDEPDIVFPSKTSK